MREEKAPEEKRKRPLITSRQIAAAAMLGGLCFAWRALGLVIPMPVPGFVIDIREPIYNFAACIYGPYVAIIIAILGGLPTPIPYAIWLGAICSMPITSFAWKNLGVWKMPWKYKVPIMYILFAIFMFIFLTILMFCASYIAAYWPFWPMYIFALTGGPYLIWWSVQSTILVILLAARTRKVPEEPDWAWR